MRVLIAACALALAACSDPNGATRVLAESGYQNIQIEGWPLFWWGCDSKDDVWATKFTATGPTGRHTSGVVCSGWFKGKTIRLN